MDSFYIIVLSIAVIFLIIILTYIGLVLIRSENSSVAYPPVKNDCPDYWMFAPDSSYCMIPANTKPNKGTLYDINGIMKINATNTPGFSGNVAIVNGQPVAGIDFTASSWNNSGLTSICSQQKWSKTWGVMIDGVSNYNSC